MLIIRLYYWKFMLSQIQYNTAIFYLKYLFENEQGVKAKNKIKGHEYF